MKNLDKENAWAYINSIVEARKKLEVSVKAALYDYESELDDVKQELGMTHIFKKDFYDLIPTIKHIFVDEKTFMVLGLAKDCEVDNDNNYNLYEHTAKIKDGFNVCTTTLGKDLREVARYEQGF